MQMLGYILMRTNGVLWNLEMIQTYVSYACKNPNSLAIKMRDKKKTKTISQCLKYNIYFYISFFWFKYNFSTRILFSCFNILFQSTNDNDSIHNVFIIIDKFVPNNYISFDLNPIIIHFFTFYYNNILFYSANF